MIVYAYSLGFTELALLAEAFSRRSRRFNETRSSEKQGLQVIELTSRHHKNAQRDEIYTLKALRTPYGVKTRSLERKRDI